MPTVRLTDRSDTYTTKDGDEFVFALGGDDRITVKGVFYDVPSDDARISVYGGPGNDRLISGTEIEGLRLYGGPGHDYIEVNGSPTDPGYAAGAGGNDVIICKFGDEGCVLDGGAGNDRLVNEKGYSVNMYGRLGDDVLDAGTLIADATYQEGGPGRDVSVGGPGRDRFILSTGDAVAGPRRDVVEEFSQGSDRIDLFKWDANRRVDGNQGFTFIGSSKLPKVGQVGYYVSGGDKIVIGNDGVATFEIRLVDFGPPLLATDFQL